MRKIIELDYCDFTMEEGKYKEEYRGNMVYDKSSDALHIFNDEGTFYTSLYCGTDSKGKFFSPKELLERKEKSSADDLVKLRDKFSTDDIIRLKEKQII